MKKAPGKKRATVVVHQGFPLSRTLPTVVVHSEPRVTLVTPSQYLPITVWHAPVVAAPVRDRIVAQDTETFYRSEGWTEVRLGVYDDGSALIMSVNGSMRLDFAEVVYAGGDVQVIDFNQQRVRSGSFLLLDVPDGRDISYVRLVGRAESSTARVTVRLVS